MIRVGEPRRQRPLVVGERCYVLGPGNKWIDAFITGITDSGRSYDTQVEATGGHLTRNRSHIKPRSHDIPMIHASFLQSNPVPSGNSDRNLSKRENSVLSGSKQLAGNSQKTVISEPHKGSIKQTNTSQVRQEGPTKQMSQDHQVSGQPCDQHCGNTTNKAAQT